MIDDFREVLDYYNIPYRERAGSAELDLLCPFHDDNNFGNARYNMNKDAFHCFSCGAKGNKTQFVSSLEKCTYKEAAELLVNNFIGTGHNYDITTLTENLNKRSKKVQEKKSNLPILSACSERILSTIAAKKPTTAFIQTWFPVLLFLKSPSSEALTEKQIVSIYSDFSNQLNSELS